MVITLFMLLILTEDGSEENYFTIKNMFLCFLKKKKKKCLRSNLSVHVVATEAGNLRESFSLRHCIRQISLELHEN